MLGMGEDVFFFRPDRMCGSAKDDACFVTNEGTDAEVEGIPLVGGWCTGLDNTIVIGGVMVENSFRTGN